MSLYLLTFYIIVYTVGHIFVCNFVNNQQISMQFSLLDLEMNGTCASMNITRLA